MKVLHIIVGTDIGGAEIALLRLIKNSQAKECAHVVISLTTVGPIGLAISDLGVEIQGVGLSKYSFWWKWFVLLRALKHHNPDVVHTWMDHANLMGGVCAKLLKKKLLWAVRKSDTDGKWTTRCVTKVCAWLSHWLPDQIVYCAHCAKANHLHYGFSKYNAKVIGNGFDLKTFSCERPVTAEEPKPFIFGSLGRVAFEKDYPNLLAAIEIVIDKVKHVRFHIAGRNVPELLKPLVDVKGLGQYIQLFGNVNAVEFLSGLDGFILPSLTEGFPNVVGEAMCCQLPCVVTDAGDSRYMVGNNGITVPINDPQALANGIITMLALTQKERNAMGEGARESIAKRFDIKLITSRYVDIYQQLMTG